tara:strand:+ start:235 stop:771 length:537 start_codon:yes stop_codon:yes gene_type:complete
MTSRYARQLVVAGLVLGLVSLGAPIYAQREANLWEAVARGDLGRLHQALEAGVDPDVLEPNGATPLIVAAMFGQTELVRFLIDNEASLDIQNNDGATALHVASLFGHPQAVELLLAAGAARELRNNDGRTPLDLVSGPWSEELDGLYEFLGAVFQMDLDIERIRTIRPEVNALLRAPN